MPRVIIYGALVLFGIIVVWGAAAHSTAAMSLLVIVALIAAIIAYFYPTIVAYNRRHTNKEAIFVLNLCLGWSIIGWAVALTWAVKKVETAKPHADLAPAPANVPDPLPPKAWVRPPWEKQ